MKTTPKYIRVNGQVYRRASNDYEFGHLCAVIKEIGQALQNYGMEWNQDESGHSDYRSRDKILALVAKQHRRLGALLDASHDSTY